ncbi:hypothetical protein MCOR25_006785 [Pyricularia grisea]|nr:hypothetical protein MCOR25_006785 [Pyricularia grisea]
MRSTVLPSNTMGVVVACLLGSFLQNTVDASLLGKKDIVHRIQKVHVVEHAVLERRALTCPVDHYSCPDSLGGNCCPQRYGCATDSCFVTTAGTGMACGRRGYYNCPLEAGTGCCPEGYVCERDGRCSPPEGVTYSIECPAGNFQCPMSDGGGCCRSGMACGKNLCYATTPKTFVITKASTAVTSGRTTIVTAVVTTVSTPVPSAIPSDTNFGLPKLFVTSVPKVEPVQAPEGSGGLTSAQIGGIAGGVAALVVIVLVATFLIFRRLRKHEQVIAESTALGTSSVGGRSSKTGGKSGMTQIRVTPYPRPTQSTIDAMEYDDLLETRTAVSTTAPHSFNRADSDVISMPSSRPTPDLRHMSIDSSAASQAGYFDLPAGTYANRHSGQTTGGLGIRSSLDSSTTGGSNVAELMSSTTVNAAATKRARHVSNASELSSKSSSVELPAAGLGSPNLPAELGQGQQVAELQADEGPGGARRRAASSGASAPTTLARPPMVHQRTGQQPLDVVSENSEVMHGYYGPSEHSGQTQAGLTLGHDISSPLETQFQLAKSTEDDKS